MPDLIMDAQHIIAPATNKRTRLVKQEWRPALPASQAAGDDMSGLRKLPWVEVGRPSIKNWMLQVFLQFASS